MSAVALVLGLLVAALVATTAARTHGWATTPARTVATTAWPTSSRAWRARVRARLPRRRPRPLGELDVAAWCDRVAGGVRAGQSLTGAVLTADAATPPPLRPYPDVTLSVSRGRSLAAALHAQPDDPSTAIGLAAPVLATCAELGGPTAGAIDRVVAVLLARAAEHDERRSASAQARLSARVMTTVPFGVAALLALTEPSIRTAMATSAGLVCLAVGSALNAGGWWWMRSMIRSAT